MEWSIYDNNNWTRRLIDDADTFPKRKRNIDYFTMQILTGYSIFDNYTVRLNKEGSPVWDAMESGHVGQLFPLGG